MEEQLRIRCTPQEIIQGYRAVQLDGKCVQGTKKVLMENSRAMWHAK